MASLRPISSEKHNGNLESLLMLNIHKQFCLIPTDPITFDPCKFLANFCHMLIFKIKSSITTLLYIQLSHLKKKSSFSYKVSKECILSLRKSASLKKQRAFTGLVIFPQYFKHKNINLYSSSTVRNQYKIIRLE